MVRLKTQWSPWRELNNEPPTAKTGTWIQEEGSTGDCVHLVDFVPVQNSWILRQGTTDKDTLHAEEFCGWNSAFENAVNGWIPCATREALDSQLRRLGILN